MNGNIFAFDECSILNQCEVIIPKAFRMLVGKEVLKPKNSSKLSFMISTLDARGIKKYKFVPSNFEENIIKVARTLIEDERLNVTLLGRTFESEVIDQLEEFLQGIGENYLNIDKSEDIEGIRRLFVNNERQLKKEKNIPDDDDLKIISGYLKFNGSSKKNLVTADEHFWGYADLIEKEYNIFIVKEWECHKHV